MDPEVITALFQGAVLVFGALGITAAQRSRRRDIGRKEYRALQREHLAALSFVFQLESELAAHGIVAPARPAILEKDSDNDGGALPPAPAPAGP